MRDSDLKESSTKKKSILVWIIVGLVFCVALGFGIYAMTAGKNETGSQNGETQNQGSGTQDTQGQGAQGEKGETGPQGPQGEKGDSAPHANEVHTVYFDARGGTLPAGYELSVTVNYGDILDLPIPTKPNYIFEGWFTGETVNDGQFTTVTPVTKDITLLARWKAEITYQLTYNTNGGNVIAPTIHYFDEQITSLPTPVKYDCTFSGWFFDARLSQRVGYPLCLTQNTEIYAGWEKAYCSVNFHMGGSQTMQPLHVEAGTKLEAFSVPDFAGHTFAGWYLDSGYLQEVSFPLEIHSDLDVFARWDEVLYTIEFQTNGGAPLNARQYPAGEILWELPIPSKPKYAFSGWYFDNLYSRAVEFPYEVTESVTLYAKWDVDPYADYIKLSTVEDLQCITNLSERYILQNDIDCKGASLPIIGSENSPFTGFFLGGGYTISDFSVSVSVGGTCVGWFALNSGTIRDLKIKKMTVTCSYRMESMSKFMGGLVGRNNGTISQVSVDATVTATGGEKPGMNMFAYCGIIAGFNSGNINNCSVSGSVTSTFNEHGADGAFVGSSANEVGGIAGLNEGTVSKCFVTAAVTSNGSSASTGAGGICGGNNNLIENCLFAGSVSGKQAKLSVFYVFYSGNASHKAVNCYKAETVLTEGGSVATLSLLNSKAFYTRTLGWDENVWELDSLNFEEGRFPKLK